ncbi:cordon-bleu protein-like 1 isoform X2 [Rhineura floridana]|nr:cordon-bleu protein-like 1 isoform X2 [Rhineura floridana]XP_061464584.1 cordon-bleu protein-like 1 isoform X2 [Rhineura floridana]XP_061464585.1 cordon-bleu protein-like 1 isoform X2 [Rhineura floridana]XP_061464590.1 cordon-bleu protein-like 1 isoform X2 [Rhineura floridana]
MEQKENIIDRDIELSVVLPDDVIKSTTVTGSKPMMDLLVYLCAQYHLNPASHTIDLMSTEKKQIKFKPNTPIGMLEVDKVILKPKQMDKKKPTPVIPEQTVRVVVNYKKTQKTIVRVSPHAPVQEIMQIICSKCDFDPLHTLLLKTYQSQETLDLTKSLNDLGLRELYAMDVSRAIPTGEFSLSSLQDSYQNSQNSDILKEKENKGFFSFFQRSKKKREQTASAPATPLINKPRPTFAMRSNTISKQYDSNTLPSEMPKKRRAPLPPMPTSQSVPQDLAQTQDRPATCIMKSSSVDETDKGLSGIGIVRTGSLQLSGTSSGNSSLKRAKRKAPSPPPRKLQSQSDNSIETGSESAESIHTEGIIKGRSSEVPSSTGNVVDLTGTAVSSSASCCFEPANHDQNNIQQVSDETNLVNAGTPDESEVSLKSDIVSEYSLEEIDEKEEMHEESAGTLLMTQEALASFSTREIPLDIQENVLASLASDPITGSEDTGQDSDEEETANMSAYDKAQCNQIFSENIGLDNAKPLGALQANTSNGHSDVKFLPKSEGSKTDAAEVRKSNKLEALNCQSCKNDVSLNQEGNPQAFLEMHDKKWDQSSREMMKTQDVAIQAMPSDDNLGQTALRENTDPKGCKLITPTGSTCMHKSSLDNQPSGFLNRVHETMGTMRDFNQQRQQSTHDRANPNDNQNNTFANDNHVQTQRVVKSHVSSPTKGYPLYQQYSKPKPKPSNEITRDYIPKVGMTTYKIVPPKSLEIVKNWEPDRVEDQEAANLHMSPKKEKSQEFGTQTEILNSESLNQTGYVFRQEVTLLENDPLHKTYSVDNATVSFSNAKGKAMEVELSRPSPDHITTPFVLNTENKSCSPPAKQEKSSILSPTAKPSNFYLQMQRRASSDYVTSAVARSGSVSSPTQNEAKSIEPEKKLASPDHTSFPFPRTVNVPSQLVEEKMENGHNEEKTEVATSPVTMPKPLNSPCSQPPPINLKTLRTFVLPQPYSSSRPSPFALAVSSAVRRSQSFSKTCASGSRSLKEQSSLDLSSSVSNIEIRNHSPLQSATGQSQQSMTDKKNNCATNEQNRQGPSFSGHPTTAVCERGIAVTLQRPDPEQIHQSLLAAIRSGEAAAKLRRVAPPSNTVAINGRSSLSSSVSVEARYSNH